MNSASSPLRVAIVTGGMPLGGTTNLALFLAEGLAAQGAVTEVFSFRQEHPLAADFEAAGVPVHRQDDSRLIYEDRLQAVYDELRRFQPDAVLANLGQEAYEVMRYLPSGVLRVGLVHDRLMNPRFLLENYGAVLDEVVVPAAYLQAELKPLFPKLRFSRLRYGVRLLPGIPPREPNPDRPLRLIYYGRLDEASKRVSRFPAIMRELKARGVQFEWTIHGQGHAREILQQQFAAEMVSGQVRFSASLSENQLRQLVRQHDVYMLTSAHEGGPLTLLESMGLGLVPVCSDIPCLVQEVIHPENGFRVPPEDPAAYAEAIARLHQDRALLERLSVAARHTIGEEFSVPALGRRYAEWLRKRVASQPASWPEKINPRPILGVPQWPYFGPVRVVRRWWKRFAD